MFDTLLQVNAKLDICLSWFIYVMHSFWFATLMQKVFGTYYIADHFTNQDLPSQVEKQLETRQEEIRQNKVLKKL